MVPFKPAKNEDEEEKLQQNENEMKLENVPNVELSLLAKPRFRAVSTTPRRRTFILQSTPRLEISEHGNLLTPKSRVRSLLFLLLQLLVVLQFNFLC